MSDDKRWSSGDLWWAYREGFREGRYHADAEPALAYEEEIIAAESRARAFVNAKESVAARGALDESEAENG